MPVAAHPGRRLVACSVLVLVVFGALAVRVAQLQVFSGDRFRKHVLAQTQSEIVFPAQRGSIYDRKGRDLALSVELSSVFADPSFRYDPLVYADQLAPVLGMDKAELVQLLARRGTRYVPLAEKVSDDVAAKVKALDLPGIGIVPEQTREYPSGTLARSLLGVVSQDPRKSWFGLEAEYDKILRGQAGRIEVERDPQGQEIPGSVSHQIDARRGTDIVLSVDAPLQWETEQSLIDQVNATHAKGGMAVVVDVTNGDVLSIASVEGASAAGPVRPSGPTDPTRPLTDLFEPGSTNKLITLSTALERGIVGPQTLIDVPSSLRIGDATYKDVDPHGDVRMSVTDILRTSSNVGTIEIARHLSNEQLADALHSFGLGRRTTVEFPSQASGLLLDPDHYYDTGLASTAIGYGVAVTGMQMLDAYVTIANGGVTRPPHLLDATIDADNVRRPAKVRGGHRVVSARVAHEMTDMLTGVVSSGTGACAAIPGYSVAGKTGTARKAVGGDYSSGTMASFIGYAPATRPRLASIVVLDEPLTEYGGTAAAPVFADVMQFALTRDGVAPDDVANAQYNAAQASAAASGTKCIDPAEAARQAAAAAAAQVAAEQAAATSTTTTTPRATTASATKKKRRSPRAGQGASASPDSLPVDTSQSG